MSRAKSIERRDYSHEGRKHQFLWVRLAFAALGTLFLLLGIIGIFMPILPTTPFLLLTTACYARSSRRFYNWLMNHRLFGPLIRECFAHLGCGVAQKVPVGDHDLFVAEVLAASGVNVAKPYTHLRSTGLSY